MANTEYLIACTVSSLGGLAVGLTVRAVLDGVLNLCRWVRNLPHKSLVIGALVVLVGAASTAMQIAQGRKMAEQAGMLAAQREYSIRVTDCQARANEAFRDSLTRRSAASAGQGAAQIRQAQEQIAQNEGQKVLFSRTLGTGQLATAAEIRAYLNRLDTNTAALREVVDELTRVQDARKENPYPPLECGAP